MKRLLIYQIMKNFTIKKTQNGEKNEREKLSMPIQKNDSKDRESSPMSIAAIRKALIAESRYDYDDMILMVRDQLRDDAHFAALIREAVSVYHGR
jgi:hypothetical protein